MVFPETVKFVLELENRLPASSMPRELDSLFARLASAQPRASSRELEDRIWSLWSGHGDPQAAVAMREATAAMAQRRLSDAKTRLDDLLDRFPHYAEAWNKRATLFFLLEQEPESVRDIHSTLELEPRHFGALSGFAQICLRAGDMAAASVALQAALRVNPHLISARDTLMEIQKRQPTTLH